LRTIVKPIFVINMKSLKIRSRYAVTAITSAIILASSFSNAAADVSVSAPTLRTLANDYFNSSVLVWQQQTNLIQSSQAIKQKRLDLNVSENIYSDVTSKIAVQKEYLDELQSGYSELAREAYRNGYYNKNESVNIFEAFGKGPNEYVRYSEGKNALAQATSATLGDYDKASKIYDELKIKQSVSLNNVNTFRKELNLAEEKYISDTSNLDAMKNDELISFISMSSERNETLTYSDIQNGQAKVPDDVDAIFKNIINISAGNVKHVKDLGSSYKDNSCSTFDEKNILATTNTDVTLKVNTNIFSASPGDTVYFLNRNKDTITSVGEYAGYGWAITSSPRSGIVSFARTQPDYVLISSSDDELNSKEVKLTQNISCTVDPWLLQYDLFETVDASSLEQINDSSYAYAATVNVASEIESPISGAVINTENNRLVIQGILSPYKITYENITTPYKVGDYLEKGSALKIYPATLSDDNQSAATVSLQLDSIITQRASIQKRASLKDTLQRNYFALHNEAIYSNGMLPDDYLCDYDQFKLRCDASIMLKELNIAYKKQFGSDIPVGNTYRTYEGQVICQAEKGRMCATPGESKHGLGLAVDFSPPLNVYNSAEHNWMLANASKYGWELPEWAQLGGVKEEPWHWEFVW